MWQPAVEPAGRVERVFEKLARALVRRGKPAERRAERRVPAHGTARMLWLRESNGDPAAVVHMLDISQLGLAVRCGHSVPVGAPILLKDRRLLVAGWVRHCTADGKDFTIGVEICKEGEGTQQHAMLRLIGA